MENMGNDNKRNIQDLIVRKITSDELGPQEEMELTLWLDQDVKNRQEYEDLVIVRNLFKQEGRKPLDTDAAWKIVNERISGLKFKHHHPSRSFGWLKYAAILVLLSSIGLFFYQNGTSSSDRLSTEIIKPGGFRAELILPDGQHVNLQDKKPMDIAGNQHALIATNTGNTLVYNVSSGQAGYHKLIVPIGAQYELVLPDKSHVWLNSGSELTYLVDFSHAPIREVRLTGEAYFKVAKDKKHPFIVKTDHMDVEAVGTAFNVSAYKDADYTETTLVEGIVNVSDKQGNKQRMLAGSKVRLFNKKQNVLAAIEKAGSVYNDYAWKEGVFVFDQMPLARITEQISRWYNIQVVFHNEELKKLRFTGSIKKDQSLNTVLKLIAASTSVRFELKGDILHITKP